MISLSATGTTSAWWFDPGEERVNRQTPIINDREQAQLDSILFFSEDDREGTTFSGAIGGWLTSGGGGVLGLLPQYLAGEPNDLVTYWGGTLDSLGTQSTYAVTVDMGAINTLFKDNSTQLIPAQNVVEIFSPAINMQMSITDATPARLILVRQSAARKARRSFHLASSSFVGAGNASDQTESSTRIQALKAVEDVCRWLHTSPVETAELCRFHARSIANWQGGAEPHQSTVRRLFEVNALVGSLYRAMGADRALLWLNSPFENDRQPRLDVLGTENGPQLVLRDAAPILFPRQVPIARIRPDFEDSELLVASSSPLDYPTLQSPPTRVRRPPEVPGDHVL